ncbi:MAG TPA: hypothetical protein VFQ75_06460 [Candidatus Limnocylindrales bacterium]|nr:hypothetical protein [Candidatus Limnocylindrales bacterium]
MPVPVAPSPAPTASMGWQRLGPVGLDRVDRLVGFAGGYVALDGRAGAVASSMDGTEWTTTRLPRAARQDDATPSPIAVDMATDGSMIVVVGGYGHRPCRPTDQGGGPGCALSPVSWTSTDGITWSRSGDERRSRDEERQFTAVWPDGTEGWEATVAGWEGEALTGGAVWRSQDGLAWAPGGAFPSAGGPEWSGPWHAEAATRTGGTRIGWQSWMHFDPDSGTPETGYADSTMDTTLARSEDGSTWTAIAGFPGTSTTVTDATTTLGDVPVWIMVGSSRAADADVPTIWTSLDGATWAPQLLPVEPIDDPDAGVVGSVTSVACPSSRCVAVGGTDPADLIPDQATWVNADARDWQGLPRRPGADGGMLPRYVAAGPSGVIGVGGIGGEGGVGTWSWVLR